MRLEGKAERAAGVYIVHTCEYRTRYTVQNVLKTRARSIRAILLASTLYPCPNPLAGGSRVPNMHNQQCQSLGGG